MAELPSGTVTLLFTDIEGSTKLLDELGPEGYRDVLGEHRRVLREAFARHDGYEVDYEGDAFFVAFSDARAAVAAARDAQADLSTGRVRVRMGLHTGEPLLDPPKYVGHDVHLAARIMSAAHGGQVLLSHVTQEFLGGVAVADLGEHRLKDFGDPVSIFQLGDERFPPLKTISNTNLPRPVSSFVGREREVGEVAALLRDGARLVTLTGPGGTGKTRLAIEAAAELVGEFRAGVFWVGLATVHDASLVLETAAQTLGAKGELPEHIGERELLLLLDNLEQVIEAAPQLAALAETCPNLRMLVTSRELLRVRGEVEYELLPLAEPEAVELFCARSQLPSSAVVRELCGRLDNMPLALELAAARTKALSPEQILERIADRLDLFKGGRDTDPRQQTLRATIEWSHDLLSAQDQRLFARLSVAAGGCTLESAEQVCGADLDGLQSLVEKSLLRHTGERFWMLETIREFALERLEESGDADTMRRRHAEFFLALAESASLTVETLERGARHEFVIPEADNLRSAIDWALAAGDAALAASLTVALEQYWVASSPEEGARRLEAVLERREELPPMLRASALRVRGGTTYIVGNFEEGTRWHEEALAAFRELGADAEVGHMLSRLAIEAHRQGDTERARALSDESLRLSPRAETRAVASSVLGDVAFTEGRGDEALDLYAESARIADEIGFGWWRNSALLALAEYALRLDRLEVAAPAAQEGLAGSHELGDRQHIVYGLAIAAWVAAAQGRTARAGRLWGAITAEAELAPVGQWEAERDEYAQHVVSGDEAFERGHATGRRLSLDEAVAEALRPLD